MTITELRQYLNMTQAELAKLLAVSVSSVARAESRGSERMRRACLFAATIGREEADRLVGE